MKTAIYKILKALSLVAMTLALANCSKSDNGNNTATTVGTYQLVGNICYQNVNGALTQVATTYCTNSGTNGYQWVNNICYQNVNGTLTQVATSYCNGTTTTGGLCNGYYSDGYSVAQCTEGTSGYQYSQANTPWGYRQVIVMDCSGYTLYNTSNQIVTCQ